MPFMTTATFTSLAIRILSATDDIAPHNILSLEGPGQPYSLFVFCFYCYFWFRNMVSDIIFNKFYGGCVNFITAVRVC